MLQLSALLPSVAVFLIATGGAHSAPPHPLGGSVPVSLGGCAGDELADSATARLGFPAEDERAVNLGSSEGILVVQEEVLHTVTWLAFGPPSNAAFHFAVEFPPLACREVSVAPTLALAARGTVLEFCCQCPHAWERILEYLPA